MARPRKFRAMPGGLFNPKYEGRWIVSLWEPFLKRYHFRAIVMIPQPSGKYEPKEYYIHLEKVRPLWIAQAVKCEDGGDAGRTLYFDVDDFEPIEKLPMPKEGVANVNTEIVG